MFERTNFFIINSLFKDQPEQLTLIQENHKANSNISEKVYKSKVEKELFQYILLQNQFIFQFNVELIVLKEQQNKFHQYLLFQDLLEQEKQIQKNYEIIKNIYDSLQDQSKQLNIAILYEQFELINKYFRQFQKKLIAYKQQKIQLIQNAQSETSNQEFIINDIIDQKINDSLEFVKKSNLYPQQQLSLQTLQNLKQILNIIEYSDEQIQIIKQLYQQDKFTEALNQCEEMIYSKHLMSIGLLWQTKCYYKLKQYDKPIQINEKLGPINHPLYYYVLGKISLKINNTAEAASFFQKVIEQKKDGLLKTFEKLGINNIMLGQIFENQKNYEKAIKHYDLGLAYEKNNRRLIERICYAKQKNYLESLKMSQLSLQINPNRLSAYIIQGIAFLKLKKFDEAIKSFDKAIQLDPNNPVAYHHKGFLKLQNKGDALQKFKKLNDAIIMYDQALSINQKYSNSYINKGTALQSQRKFNAAMSMYEKALNIDQYDSNAYYHKGLTQFLFDKGNILQIMNKLDEAILMYDKAIQINSKYANAYINKGNALSSLNKFDQAIQMYDLAIQIKPNYEDAYINKGKKQSYLKGHIFQTLDKYDDAILMYNKVIELNSRNDDAYYSKGCALYEQDKFDEALLMHNMAIQLNPKNSYAYYVKGNCLQQLNRQQEALQMYDISIRLNPSQAAAYSNKGSVLHKLQRFDEALQIYDIAIKLNPNSANAFAGISLEEVKRFDEAILMFNKALQIDPNNSNVYDHKGRILLKQNKYTEAIIVYSRIIQINPQYADAYELKSIGLQILKGFALYQMDDYDEALMFINKAIQIDPNNFQYLYEKAFIIFQQSRFDLAIDMFQKCLQLNSQCANAYFLIGSKSSYLGKSYSFLGMEQNSIEYINRAFEMNPELQKLNKQNNFSELNIRNN
ncbi:Stress-induced-phosphoprotein 1 [Paramecium bursaria]